MIERYGFFDSLEEDERVYAEADFARFTRTLAHDGVYGGVGALKVTPSLTGLGVNVAEGMAIVQGRHYALEDDGSGAMTLALGAAQAHPRIDRIVLTLNFGARTITLGVLRGEEASVPQPPALHRSAEVYMLALASVRVAVGAGSVAGADVTDERADDALCGLHAVSASAAGAAAEAARKLAELAQKAAGDAGKKAQEALDKSGVTSVNGKTGDVTVKVGVGGAQEGHVALFDKNGDLVTSGKSFWAFTRAKMTLDGTVLTITTMA